MKHLIFCLAVIFKLGDMALIKPDVNMFESGCTGVVEEYKYPYDCAPPEFGGKCHEVVSLRINKCRKFHGSRLVENIETVLIEKIGN